MHEPGLGVPLLALRFAARRGNPSISLLYHAAHVRSLMTSPHLSGIHAARLRNLWSLVVRVALRVLLRAHNSRDYKNANLGRTTDTLIMRSRDVATCVIFEARGEQKNRERNCTTDIISLNNLLIVVSLRLHFLSLV